MPRLFWRRDHELISATDSDGWNHILSFIGWISSCRSMLMASIGKRPRHALSSRRRRCKYISHFVSGAIGYSSLTHNCDALCSLIHYHGTSVSTGPLCVSGTSGLMLQLLCVCYSGCCWWSMSGCKSGEGGEIQRSQRCCRQRKSHTHSFGMDICWILDGKARILLEKVSIKT